MNKKKFILKDWLKENKIYFETFAALLLGIMAILLSASQVFISCQQNKLVEKQMEIADTELRKSLLSDKIQFISEWNELKKILRNIEILFPFRNEEDIKKYFSHLSLTERSNWLNDFQSKIELIGRNRVIIENKSLHENYLSIESRIKDIRFNLHSDKLLDIQNNFMVQDFFRIWRHFNIINIYMQRLRPIFIKSSKFLHIFLNSNLSREQYNYLSNTTTGLANLSGGLLNDIVLPSPSLTEQIQIADFLNKKTTQIDDLISKKEHLIELLEEEKIAVINQAVTKGIDPDVKLKDSGIDWLGKIPKHWEVARWRYLFSLIKNIAGKTGLNILSITQSGIKIKNIENNDGQLSSDYSKYQIVNKNDFAMNSMDLLTGFIDISQYEGVTSPDYKVFRLIDKKSIAKYYLYIFQMNYKLKVFYALGSGAAMFGRWRLPTDELKQFLLPRPPKIEQMRIVKHINSETTRIDDTIKTTKKLIELLKEYRTALISEVVTGKIKVIKDEEL